MKHRPRSEEQDDLLRPRLVDMIDLRHELAKLAELIDWDFFEAEWAGFFPSTTGRPATPPRLVAGLLYLQHAYRLSDEAVVARWVENPYYQHFTGETFFQHRPPIDPSSLVRWRKRIGEDGVEWLLTKTIEAGLKSGAVDGDSLGRVAVDTTVMEKNIAHPTDARLYEKARRQLVALAVEGGIDLRQNYNRLAPPLAMQVGRYAHAKQFRRMRKALKKLKGYAGRVLRDIRRQLQDEFRELTKSLGKSAVFITHDLEEAIRIGDRIAIMKDGVIVQIGTAEDIVTKPADDYVSDFVAGISRIHLVKAHSVMRPVGEFKSSQPHCDVNALPQTSPDADIGALIDLTTQSDRDAVAVVENGSVVGVVTIRGLLRGVAGKPTGEPVAA